jgi:hypothetical protein
MIDGLSRVSLTAKDMFIMYLIISANFLVSLFPCQVQYQFRHNMLIKHLFGFLTVFFFISLADNSNYISENPTERLAFAALIYLWFLLTSKMSLTFWSLLVFVVGVIYIIQIYKEFEMSRLNRDESRIEKFAQLQNALGIVAVITTVLGFVSYMGEKRFEYGERFSFGSFISGLPTCKSDAGVIETMPIGFVDKLKYGVGLK